MHKVSAGDTINFSYSVAVDGDSYTARVTDALGKHMSATATVNGQVVDLAVNADQWCNGQGGTGFIEITKTLNNIKTTLVSEKFRISPSLNQDLYVSDYA